MAGQRRADGPADPFAVLGLPPSATLDEVRAARRRLAKELHPDRGGDAARMQAVNAAFDQAVKAILRPPAAPGAAPGPHRSPPPGASGGPSRSAAGPAGARSGRVPGGRRVRRVGPPWEQDVSSFTVDVLPVEAFEALLVVTSWVGEVLVDDPPYLLEVVLHEPSPCWCRLDLVPEAGASTVSLLVAALDTRPPPSVEAVRDLYVILLNQLGGEEDHRSP